MDQVSPAPPHEGLLWSPSNVKDHQLTKLRELINAKHDLALEDYHQLHQWSCDHYNLFWGHVWDVCHVVSSTARPELAIDKDVPIQHIPQWFEGVQLNYAENLLRHTNDDKIALYYTSERKTTTGNIFRFRNFFGIFRNFSGFFQVLDK